MCTVTKNLRGRIMIVIAILTLSILINHVRAEPWTIDGDFAIGMLTVDDLDDINRLAADGFNLVHVSSYNPVVYTAHDYLTRAEQQGVKVALAIGGGTNVPAATQANVANFATYDSLAWWSIEPEEARFWVPAEFQALQNASAVIRANDPADRPVFTYQQTHFNAAALANYTPYIDGIAAGAYANYANRPRPWVRWRIEQEVQAIEMGGNQPGQFPVAVLQMFSSGATLTGADAYHDAYLSLVTGAKAILIYGDAYRNTVDSQVYQSYKKVAAELNGTQRLGDAFLLGTKLDALHPSITSGPLKSQSFTDFESPANTFQYDSISSRVMVHNGHIYLSAVNSAGSTVGATFNGVRYNNGETSIDVLFESRTVTMGPREFSDTFAANGVHTYKLPSSADLVLREDHFDSAVAWTARYGNGTITASAGIGTVNRGSESTEYFYSPLAGGSLPHGAFLELKINSNPSTEFYLQLVGADLQPLAVIPWQAGTGQWQTVQVPFSGEWWSSTNSLWLGIRGGSSYQVDALGIYFRAPTSFGLIPEPGTLAPLALISVGARVRRKANF